MTGYVVGRLTEGQARGTFEQGPPVGDVHAVDSGAGLETLCGITVLHIEQQQEFPPQVTDSGHPDICPQCFRRWQQG